MSISRKSKYAFPQLGDNGMTLRDYFAAKAMQGFAADSTLNLSANQATRMAYLWADAMTDEREKPYE